MKEVREHGYIPTLKRNFAEGKVDRREFLRTSTLLGMSAAAAYAFMGQVTGESFAPRANAQTPKKGGHLRISTGVIDVKDPHTFSWGADIARDTLEYLTKTGVDNVTRPYLLDGWSASDDLRTWTLNIRKDVKWHNGRSFDADDVVWNLNHVLDPGHGFVGSWPDAGLYDERRGHGEMGCERGREGRFATPFGSMRRSPSWRFPSICSTIRSR